MEGRISLRILIDNTPDADGRLMCEHGLSIYTEIGGKRILIDTGLSGKAMDNALMMGIDVGEIDYVILSHGHRDHCGGLGRLRELNGKAAIVCGKGVMDWDYTSDSRGHRHSLNPDREVLMSWKDKTIVAPGGCWRLDCGDAWICAGLCDCRPHPCPGGNSLLHVNGNPYGGEDELVISVWDGRAISVVSPCSHSGMMNIVECAEGRHGMRVSQFVGGLHFVEGCADVESLPEFAGRLPRRIVTGHCTCSQAKERLRDVLGDRVAFFRTGDTIVL